MPKYASYTPGVTFFQEFGDIMTTMRYAGDSSKAGYGHTYIVDGVEDVANAFFPNDYSKNEQAKIEQAAVSVA